MDYYRRYTGDYLKKTLRLSMVEDGAYTRLLDHYYTEEGPLPKALDEVYKIARATKPAERDAVRAVLDKHFDLQHDGYHNERADEELGIAVPKIARLREVARENGKKGGNPKKKAQYNEPGALYAVQVDADRIKVGISKHLAQRVSALRTQHGTQASLILAVHVTEMGKAEAAMLANFSAYADGEMLLHMPAPERRRLISEMLKMGPEIKRGSDPESGGDPHPDPAPDPQPNPAQNPHPDPAHTRASQATVNRQPPTKDSLSDHRFPGVGDTPTSPPTAVDGKPPDKPEFTDRVLEECRRAQLSEPTEANAVVMRWLHHGATPSLMVNALAEARRARPAPAELSAGYVDPIVERLLKLERQTRAATGAKVERTQEMIAETRAAKDTAAAPPDDLLRKYGKRNASA
jgi:uncharacterized protein YdaU (DUF1376 family)